MLNKTNFGKIKDFHTTFNAQPDPTKPTVIDEGSRLLRARLIFEEMQELFEEIGVEIYADYDGFFHLSLTNKNPIDLAKIGKECADLLVVTYGTGAAFGLPMDEIYDKVHESNMSKLTKDGKVLRREDGKILKSDQYKEPNIKDIIS